MLEIDFETIVDDEDIIDEFHTFKSTLERAYCMVLFPLPLFPSPPSPFPSYMCLLHATSSFLSIGLSVILPIPLFHLLPLLFPALCACYISPSLDQPVRLSLRQLFLFHVLPSFLLPCSMFLLRLFFLSISLTAIYIFIFYSSFVSTPPPSPSLPPSLDPSALLCSPPPSLLRHSSQYCLGRIWSGTVS